MKRLDLHIHTVASPLDKEFDFDPAVLREHVENSQLDAIAITNHNLFDQFTFDQARSALPDSVCVLPGIEVSVKSFHVIVIADPRNIEDLKAASKEVPEIKQDEDGIPLEKFIQLFGDGSYIVIPHFKKKPAIPSNDLTTLGEIVSALEVSSQKKWHREFSRVEKPVVAFSDFRCGFKASVPTGKYTYARMGDVTFDSLKMTLLDRTKFAVTERKNHMELAPNLHASMGLNVIVGGRSSGKTYFLDTLNESYDSSDVVYIPQFGIVKNAEDKAFKEILDAEGSAIKSAYYEPMNAVSSAIIDLPSFETTQNSIKQYWSELVEFADSTARDDEFSKCPIYSEARLAQVSSASEQKVVRAIITLLEDDSMPEEIASILGHGALVELLKVAIERYKQKEMARKIIESANSIAKTIKRSLTIESSRPACPESPMIDAAKRLAYLQRFAALRSQTKRDKTVDKKPIGKFNRITKRVPYKDAAALKKALGLKSRINMANVLQLDDLEFVECILATEGVSDVSHALFDLNVSLKNERDEDVSGGQKAEYLFFRELDRASNHDIVLIDEPESSFDNPFLNKEIVTELKKISTKATVFIATHNNVLGISIKPDGIVYTTVEDGKHCIYTCDAGDEFMLAADGSKRNRSEVLLKLMEAGGDAYEDRRPYYGLT